MGQYGVKLALLMLAVGKKTTKKNKTSTLPNSSDPTEDNTAVGYDIFLPQKHISEVPFLRIWDFTVFVAAQHLRPTLEWSPILLLQQLLLLLPWAYIGGCRMYSPPRPCTALQ